MVNENEIIIKISDQTNGILTKYDIFEKPRYVLQWFDILDEETVHIESVREVIGHGDRFLISESGILISRTYNKVLSQCKNHNGYYYHATKAFGNNYCFRIHRLVAEAFVLNTENKPYVNHVDGNKTNNHFSNLEWVTNKENMVHAKENGLLNPINGFDHPCSKLTTSDFKLIKDLKSLGYSYRKIAKILRVNKNTIRDYYIGESYKNINSV